MSDDITQRLTEIRARLKASTQGAWGVTRYSGGLSFHGDPKVYCGTDQEFGEPMAIPCNHNREADAVFIAHAHQDVPWLLEQLERAQAGKEGA